VIEKDAFSKKVMAAETTLYRVARTYLRQEADQKDAVAEAVYKAWANRHKLRDEQLFQGWLTRILINECKQLLRKQSRVHLVESSQLESISADEELQAVRQINQALDTLDEKLRIAVVLHYLEGFTLKEAAGILKIPIGSVKARLHRARKALQIEMETE
jgi:RNA polymerase sigma factor, sigma-70 family